MMNGRSERFMNGPSTVVDAHLNRCPLNAGFGRPISNSHRSAVKGERPVEARIAHLYRNRLPFDIFRLVVTIVVDAANRVLGGRCASNVFKKCFKRFSPPLTNRDAPPTVTHVAARTFHCASGNYSCPRPVFFGPLAYLVVTMLSLCLFAIDRCRLPLKAPAALGCAATDGHLHNWALGSAFAPAQPPSATDSTSRWPSSGGHHSPSSERQAYHGDLRRMRNTLVIIAKGVCHR